MPAPLTLPTFLRRPFGVFVAVVVLYLGITGLYAKLGYLENLDKRIVPLDSVYCYAFLRSAFFDHDLDFTNEFTTMWSKDEVFRFKSPTGLPGNTLPVGPAILWLPLFLLGHLATLLANELGARIPADGYSSLYQLFVYVGNSLYSLAAFFFLAKILKRFVSDAANLTALSLTLLATPLTYYVWSFSAYAHNVSFFAVTFFLYSFLETGASRRTAAAAGLMFLCRWQDLLYASLLLLQILLDLADELRAKTWRPLPWLLGQASLALVFLAVVSPQLAAWKIIYGSFILTPPGVQVFDFWRPHLLQTLFGLQHGLLSWHPILLLGLLGLALLWRRSPRLTVGLYAALACQIYFVASIGGLGYSFGNRYFIGGLPFFCLGLGLLADKLAGAASRLPAMLAGALCCGLVVWNQLFIFQDQNYLIPHDGSITFRQFFTDKFQLSSVVAADTLFLRARDALMRDDAQTFHHFAKQAYELYPEDEKKALALGLAAIMVNDLSAGGRCFEQLHSTAPEEPLYRFGLAYFLTLRGAPERAAALLNDNSTPRSRAFLQRLEQNQQPLDDAFYEDAFKKLSSLQNM